MAKIQNPQDQLGRQLATIDEVKSNIDESIETHAKNAEIHVSPTQTERWDSAVGTISTDTSSQINVSESTSTTTSDTPNLKTYNISVITGDIEENANHLVTSSKIYDFKKEVDEFESAFNSHENNNSKHISDEERIKWNKAVSSVSTTNSDTINCIISTVDNENGLKNIEIQPQLGEVITGNRGLVTGEAVATAIEDLSSTISAKAITSVEGDNIINTSISSINATADGDFIGQTLTLSVDTYNTEKIDSKINSLGDSICVVQRQGSISSTSSTNARGFGDKIIKPGILKSVRIFCPDNASNNTVYLKVFLKGSSKHEFKGISDTSLTHGAGKTLNYTFHNSNIVLGAGSEYFFVFANEAQKLSTNFSDSNTDSVDCCLKIYNKNTSEPGGLCGSNGYSRQDRLAVYEIYLDKSSIKTDNYFDKANNISSIENGKIKDTNGNIIGELDEAAFSSQYMFRTTNGGESNPLSYSNLTQANLRTIHTSLDGTTTNNSNDPIETGRINRTESRSVEYEQDLLWKNDEEFETLGNLINGTGMFIRNKIRIFNDDLTCLTTAKGMFGTNRELTDFKSPLPSLVNAKSMFTGCRALTNWRVKLPSLVIGANMFSDTGNSMELSSVDTCLPNLTMARQMFAGCTKLTKFHVPSTSFSNLYDAREMFYGCPITSINGNFESLEDGTDMLPNAHLDLASIQNIAETIRDWSDGYPAGTDENRSPKTITPTISLGIGFDDIDGDEKNAIADELDKIQNKGWNVPVSWNGPATDVSVINETSKIFFARLYDSGAFNTHIDENGKPCSIITTDSLRWISDKDSWSPMVSSLEEAEAYFKLIKIEKVEESTEEII